MHILRLEEPKFLFSDGEASLRPDCFAEELWHANGRGYGCRDVLTTGGQCHAARLGFMSDEVDGKERPAHVIRLPQDPKNSRDAHMRANGVAYSLQSDLTMRQVKW